MQMSKSAVQKLGKQLEIPGRAAEEALSLLEDWLIDYDGLLSATRGVVDELCDTLEWPLSVTHRLKTTDTLVQKLQRAKEDGASTNLARIQDIAGIRVSGAVTLPEQDQLRDWVIGRFEAQGHRCATKDRRLEPVVGYRAVHVIVTLDGRYVEVQIRTTGQDLWANVFERVADIFGRRIRYGGAPEYGGQAVVDVIQSMEAISARLYELECRAYEPGSDREDALSVQQPLLDQLHELLGYTEAMKGRLSS